MVVLFWFKGNLKALEKEINELLMRHESTLVTSILEKFKKNTFLMISNQDRAEVKNLLCNL